jgi:hypothetical protein
LPAKDNPYEKAFSNHVGKGEDAGGQHFPLFLHCFLPKSKKKLQDLIHIENVCNCFQFGKG